MAERNREYGAVWPPRGEWSTTDQGYFEKNIEKPFEPEEPNRDCTHQCEDCECEKPKAVMSGSWPGPLPPNIQSRIIYDTHGGNGIQFQDTLAVYTEPAPDGRKVLGFTGHETVDRFLHDTLSIMRKKGHDYRQGNDADLIHNFRNVALSVDEPMEKVWFTYFYKHYAALTTFIKNGGQSESEPIEGRISDMIVYLLLFHEIIQEKKKNTK